MIDRSMIFSNAHDFAYNNRKLFPTYRTAFAQGLRKQFAPVVVKVDTVDQASIKSRLNRAANNALTLGQRAATSKQVGYLAHLMMAEVAKFGVEGEPALHNSNFVLTSREASRLITIYAR